MKRNEAQNTERNSRKQRREPEEDSSLISSVSEMFHTVIFESTNEVEVVPEIWVEKTTCLWPPDKRDETVKAVRSQEPPGALWLPYKVHTILNKATHEEERVKLPEAERSTDLTDSEDSPHKRKRRRLKKNPFLQDDEETLNAGQSGSERTAISEFGSEGMYDRTPILPSTLSVDVESLTGGKTTSSQARNSHSSILINSETQPHQPEAEMQTSVNGGTVAWQLP
ncbi:hypothetical protein MHYP_G00092470 [Metynnis hypsauchen]